MAEYDKKGIFFEYPEEWQLQEVQRDNSFQVKIKGDLGEIALVQVFDGNIELKTLLEIGKKDLVERFPKLNFIPSEEFLLGKEAPGLKMQVKGTKDTLLGKLMAQGLTDKTVLIYLQLLGSNQNVSMPKLENLAKTLQID